jgi:hypothetical protein
MDEKLTHLYGIYIIPTLWSQVGGDVHEKDLRRAVCRAVFVSLPAGDKLKLCISAPL